MSLDVTWTELPNEFKATVRYMGRKGIFIGTIDAKTKELAEKECDELIESLNRLDKEKDMDGNHGI
jgi:hypothetical protein